MLLPFIFALSTLSWQLTRASVLEQKSSDGDFVPVGFAIETEPNANTSPYGQSLALTPSKPVVTLDYGYEVAGYPFFEISKLDGIVQIEVKYSEEFAGLLAPYGDGPWMYSVGLSNTFRVETFNITKTGRLDAFFLQGGQRWQSIKLLTKGKITFSRVGYEASIDKIDPQDIPSHFSSENSLFNDIWTLGARAVSAACLAAGTQRAIWEISPKNGALVRGMRAAVSNKGQRFSDYTLTFYSKIARGGTGWAVAISPSSRNGGIQLNLVGDLPESATFVNTNRTLTPPNTLVLGYGYNPYVNQTTLPSFRLAEFPIPFPVHEETWYKISTTIGESFLEVTIDDLKILKTSISNYWLPATITATANFSSNSFGFGGYQDQVAYIKNVTVIGSTGDLLYSNPMTESSIFEEYGVHENYASVCLDGPKRDRLVWLGDFFHTVRIRGTTTNRWDFVTGTLRNSIAWQSATTGLLPIAQNLGYPASSKTLAPVANQGNLALFDYQMLGFIAFYEYVEETGDVGFVRSTWRSWQLQLEYLIGMISETTGLIDVPSGFAFIGPASNGLAVSCAMVQTLNSASKLAFAINDVSAGVLYQNLAITMTTNINSKLWNEELGVYSISLSDSGNFSVAGISFAITSGVATSERALKSLTILGKLKLGPGYKDSSEISSSDPAVNISPNTNGFLLRALMQSNQSAVAASLIETLWGAMVTNNETSTGASWEYVGLEGQPGLGLFTSLSHPWGGAATYMLTKYVAGIRPAEWGYKKWIIKPDLEFGLRNVSSKVQTPFGRLSVEWKVRGKKLSVTTIAPKGTSGKFVFGATQLTINGGGKKSFTLNI